MKARKIVERYLKLVAAGGPREAVEALLHPEMTQIEYANAMTPKTRARDREAVLRGLTLGAQMMARQDYGPPIFTVDGDRVVAEFDWSGITAIDLGPLAAGTRLEARICAVIEVRDGRVHTQRSYDCYAPPTPPR
ncbi:MAG: nuclear transport factor 2 family protein [Myxococcales bacterium]|nr:nuclear transport factor 2 family protein [Myxococcales bacterium]